MRMVQSGDERSRTRKRPLLVLPDAGVQSVSRSRTVLFNFAHKIHNLAKEVFSLTKYNNRITLWQRVKQPQAKIVLSVTKTQRWVNINDEAIGIKLIIHHSPSELSSNCNRQARKQYESFLNWLCSSIPVTSKDFVRESPTKHHNQRF